MARARAVKTHHALHHSRGAFTNKCARVRAGIDRYVAELRMRFGASGRYGFERRQLSMPGQTDGRTDGHPTVTYRPCTACSVYNKQRYLPIFVTVLQYVICTSGFTDDVTCAQWAVWRYVDTVSANDVTASSSAG